jgi:hypothetical protein
MKTFLKKNGESDVAWGERMAEERARRRKHYVGTSFRVSMDVCNSGCFLRTVSPEDAAMWVRQEARDEPICNESDIGMLMSMKIAPALQPVEAINLKPGDEILIVQRIDNETRMAILTIRDPRSTLEWVAQEVAQ